MATADVNPGEAATREAYEEEHVHQVYSQIAHHFSSTRYKVCTKSFSSFSLFLAFDQRFLLVPVCADCGASPALANSGAVPERTASRGHRAGHWMRQWQVPHCES